MPPSVRSDGMLPSCCWAVPAAPAAAPSAAAAAAVLLPLLLPLLLPPRAPLRLSVAEPISFKTRSLRRKASRELCGVACASAQPAAAERRLMVWPSNPFWRLERTVACLVDRGRVSCQYKSCPESRENHHCTGAPGCPTNHPTSPQPCPNPVGYVTIMHTPSDPTVAAQCGGGGGGGGGSGGGGGGGGSGGGVQMVQLPSRLPPPTAHQGAW